MSEEPISAELNRLRAEALPKGVVSATASIVGSARNATITDTDGREFIDFSGGIGVMNVGHSHPKVVATAHAQIDRFAHTSISVFPWESYIRLAAKLNEKTPGETPKRTMFVNSGAEAVENAVKIARAATGRPGIVCFQNGFHGRTNLAMGLTSKITPYKKDFGPFPADIYRLPFAYCYRCPLGKEHPSCGTACADLLEQAFENQFQADRIACVIAEPVQGEGGFIAPPPEYHAKLKGHLRGQRHPLHRRRGADRLRPHRQALRHGALRRGGRHHDHGQVPGRRLSAGRHHRQGGRHGRACGGRHRRHVRR
jgi:4-aminobutyrate aminotransferase / (S)-3-amino-2-methylpropionate transaminase / 5-aminovalerate transaminase